MYPASISLKDALFSSIQLILKKNSELCVYSMHLLMTAVEMCLLICVVALCRANVGRSPTGGRLGRFQLEFARSRSLLPVAAGGRGEGRLRSLVPLHCTSATEGNRSHATCGLNLVEQTDGHKKLCCYWYSMSPHPECHIFLL